MKKSLIFVFCVMLLLPALVLTGSAADYTSDIPDYVNFSGGAFFEILDANLGTVTCVFPIEFQDDCFGFNDNGSGVPTNIVNLTNTTVNGVIILRNGTRYDCRATRFNVVEYRVSNYGDYVQLAPNVAGMSNTNINFLTSDELLYNETYFDQEKFLTVSVLLIGLCEFGSLLCNLFRRGRR